MMIAAFLLFLALFTAVGLASTLKSRGTKADYYTASGSIAPWLVGLSAVATNNSGYMFIGVIGYTYATGLPAVWLMLGWLLGDFMASRKVHHRLRLAVERSGAVSYASLLSQWYGQKHSRLQQVVALISLVFLLTYASAQLVAGSKTLQALLDWPPWAGAVVGAALVAAYSFAGGIRASIWTDAVQSVVMFIAMGVLLFAAVDAAGGASATLTGLTSVEGYMNPVPPGFPFEGAIAIAVFLVGWLFAGASVIGQPHIMVRFFTLDDPDTMHRARAWYYLWFAGFYAMATGVGLMSRLLLPESASFDPELALPTLSTQLLPPALVGLILAGVFSATLSTADSLILSCSSALSHDLFSRKLEHVTALKWLTLGVILTSLGIALFNHDSVFSLVLMSWSGLASAFAPILIFLVLGYRPSEGSCLTALALGFTTAVLWRLSGLHTILFEGLPGVCLGLATLWLGEQLNQARESAQAARATAQSR